MPVAAKESGLVYVARPLDRPEELKAVFDPRGDQWIEGRYVPSLLAAIGGVIERHLTEIGFWRRPTCRASPTRPSSG